MKLSSSGYEEEYPLSPVFSQEFAPDTQSQPYVLLPLQNLTGSSETSKRVRASFTALGLALSLGATGSLFSSAEAADSTQLAALPSVAGSADALPSFGSSRPEGMSASYHTVADGETIWDIANQHGLTVEDIKLANGIAEGQVIQSGQVLKVPTVVATAATLLSPVAIEVEVEKAAAPAPEQTTQKASELQVAALPDRGMPAAQPRVTIDELQLSQPQAAPSAMDTRAAAPIPDVDETANRSVAAPRREAVASPSESADGLTRGQSVAMLDVPETEISAVRQLSEQLNATLEPSATKHKVETAPQDSLQLLSAEGTLTHRVGSGETIWSIARSYGLDPETLQQANDIADPRFVMPGEEIVIPADQPLSISPSPETERLSHRQASSERQMAALTPVIEVSSPSLESAEAAIAADREAPVVVDEVTGITATETTTVAVADPFVADMLSEVAAATQSQVGGTASAAARQVSELSTTVAIETSDDSAVATPEVEGFAPAAVAVNPQFSETASDAELTEVDARRDAEDLLAAAPLGAEVYAPMVENPTGRVVTPEMPVMPGQDAYLPEAPNRFDGYMWPAQGVLTSGYGWRWGRMHRGVDIAGPVGTPIYAAGPGVVVASGWNSGGYGNLVDIRHPDGSMTRYAHNSRLMVSSGQQVRQGQQIAEMGSTGYSTGPHLHFEIHIPNQGTVNPMAMLPGR